MCLQHPLSFWQGWGTQGHMNGNKEAFFGRHEGRRDQCYFVSGSLSRLGFFFFFLRSGSRWHQLPYSWAAMGWAVFLGQFKDGKMMLSFLQKNWKNTVVMFSDQIVTDCHRLSCPKLGIGIIKNLMTPSINDCFKFEQERLGGKINILGK